MKKLLSLLLAFCLVFTTGAITAVGETSWYEMFWYYCDLYESGGMAEGPGTMIGDPTFNETINACDALLILNLPVRDCLYDGAPREGNNEKPLGVNYLVEYFEKMSYLYYKNGFHERPDDHDWSKDDHNYINRTVFNCYLRDSHFLSDVTNDCQVTAEDALMILQYAVGKIDSFPRTDYTGRGDFQYMMWPEDGWYPTMYCDMRKKGNEDYYSDIAHIFEIPPMETE